MCEPTVPVLPLDIIGNIIDILIDDYSKDGLRYVKTFSLDIYTSEAFGKYLLETPGIAKYIRHLNIGLFEPRTESRYFDQVSRQLTGLQSLTVHSLFFGRPWNSISSSMQHSLLNLIHHPTLSHLKLRYLDFPTCNLTNLNIKHLSVDSLNITGEDDDTASLLKPIQLQAFDIGAWDPSYLRLLAARCSDGRPVLDFTDLEKACVNFHGVDAVVPTREILGGSEKLADIRLKVGGTHFRAMESAKMVAPSLHTLRRMHLEIRHETTTTESDDPLAGLCDELESISGKNKLEYLRIDIKLMDMHPRYLGDEWGRLDMLLLKSGSWPMLKHVSLVVFVHHNAFSENLEVALKSLPRTQLTKLTSSKDLDFQFSVRLVLYLESMLSHGFGSAGRRGKGDFEI